MLSVVLATFNEEKNIHKCISEIKDLADEIIVVDGSSTDKTVQIAKTLGAKVIRTTNKPNFHINKQLAMDAARGELVLQLDADEWPDAELKTSIQLVHTSVMHYLDLKSISKTDPVAWWLKRKNYFLGTYFKKGGQYPDPVIRLYVRGYASLPQKDVHEQMSVRGETATLEGNLIHYANPTFADYLRKFVTYTTFKAEQLQQADTPVNFSTFFQHVIYKPLATFFSIFVRHKGFVDGVAGFVFAIMSGLHHAVAFLQLWETKENKKHA